MQVETNFTINVTWKLKVLNFDLRDLRTAWLGFCYIHLDSPFLLPSNSKLSLKQSISMFRLINTTSCMSNLSCQIKKKIKIRHFRHYRNRQNLQKEEVVYRIYPCIMRTFFSIKTNIKIAVRIIHGFYCLSSTS